MRRPTARNESRRPRHSRARLQNDHLVQASPSSPTTGMWLSQNASMRRHPPASLRATIQLYETRTGPRRTPP